MDPAAVGGAAGLATAVGLVVPPVGQGVVPIVQVMPQSATTE